MAGIVIGWFRQRAKQRKKENRKMNDEVKKTPKIKTEDVIMVADIKHDAKTQTARLESFLEQIAVDLNLFLCKKNRSDEDADDAIQDLKVLVKKTHWLAGNLDTMVTAIPNVFAELYEDYSEPEDPLF